MGGTKKAAFASGGATPAVDVYVKLPSGRTVHMDMMPADAVRNIYSRIAEEEGVPEDRVVIKYTGKVLRKKDTIGYLGVRAETILKAEVFFPLLFQKKVVIVNETLICFSTHFQCKVFFFYEINK